MEEKYISFSKRFYAYSFIFIILTASFLRLSNLNYGLPTVIHPDEKIVILALKIADPSKLDFDPHFYNYPAFQIYMLSACYYVYGALSPGGSWTSPLLPDQTTAISIARLITTFFGIATIAAVYLLGLIFDTHLTGLLAAIVLAFTPFHVADSHYTNIDIPMTFWLVISLVFVFRYLRYGGLRDFFITAACVGLAGATKYTGLLIGLIIPAAPLLKYKKKYNKIILFSVIGCLVCCVFFIIGAPYTLIKFKDVMASILWERAHVRHGHWGFDTMVGGAIYKPFIYHLCAGLPFVLGIPLYIASWCGLIASFVSVQRPKLFLLLSAYIPITVVIFSAVVVFLRYLIPLTPIAALLTGYLFSNMIHKQSKILRLTGMFLFAVLTIYSFTMSKSLVDGLVPQNAILASDWIVKNIEPGSEIAVGMRVWTLNLPENTYDISKFNVANSMENKYKPKWLIISGWYDKAWQRGNLAKGISNKYLQSLGTPKSEYENIITFKTTFFNEHIYEKLDPYFGNQFESPDISIFRLKTPK